MTHICVSNLTIGSDNGLSPCRRQAIIWTNVGILLIGPLGTNFSEILIEIHTYSFKKMHLKMSSGKWPPFCLGLNVLKPHERRNHEKCSFDTIFRMTYSTKCFKSVKNKEKWKCYIKFCWKKKISDSAENFRTHGPHLFKIMVQWSKSKHP